MRTTTISRGPMLGIEVSFLCLVSLAAGRAHAAADWVRQSSSAISPASIRTSRARGSSGTQSVYSPLSSLSNTAVNAGRPSMLRSSTSLCWRSPSGPGGADLHLDPVQVGIGVDDQRPVLLADVEHHVLRVRAVGVCVWVAWLIALADGVLNPSCGVPRYGNVDW